MLRSRVRCGGGLMDECCGYRLLPGRLQHDASDDQQPPTYNSQAPSPPPTAKGAKGYRPTCRTQSQQRGLKCCCESKPSVTDACLLFSDACRYQLSLHCSADWYASTNCCRTAGKVCLEQVPRVKKGLCQAKFERRAQSSSLASRD